MRNGIRCGATVQTPYGVGTVLEVRPNGTLVDVSSFAVFVAFADLKLVGGPSGTTKSSPELPKRALPDVAARAKWLRSVEALRFGIVPSEALERITVGYDRLQEWVEEQLPHSRNGRAQIAQVTGRFGTGKSHSLAVVRHIAANAGYLTAHVEIDGNMISFAEPAQLLYQLMSTLDFRAESTTPTIELCTRANGRGHAQALARLEQFAHIHDNYQTVATLKQVGKLDEFEEMLDLLISGSETFSATDLRTTIRRSLDPFDKSVRSNIVPTRMISITVSERPADFARALGGFARLAERAGLKGLVTTVDEFELESRFDRVEATLDGLSRELLAHPAALSAPMTMFVGVVPQSGQETDPALDHITEKSGGATRPLQGWSSAQLKDLAKRVHALYAQAYALTLGNDTTLYAEVLKEVHHSDDASEHVRTFIKRYVAKLDSMVAPATQLVA